MRIAVSASKPSFESHVDQRFARCPYFVIVDPDTMSFEGVANLTATLGSGSGIQAARLLADKGVSTVITGGCGPNAWQTLSAAGIEVILGCRGTVRQLVDRYMAGKLHPVTGSSAPVHAGRSAARRARHGAPRGRGVGQHRGRGHGDVAGGGVGAVTQGRHS